MPPEPPEPPDPVSEETAAEVTTADDEEAVPQGDPADPDDDDVGSPADDSSTDAESEEEDSNNNSSSDDNHDDYININERQAGSEALPVRFPSYRSSPKPRRRSFPAPPSTSGGNLMSRNACLWQISSWFLSFAPRTG